MKPSETTFIPRSNRSNDGVLKLKAGEVWTPLGLSILPEYALKLFVRVGLVLAISQGLVACTEPTDMPSDVEEGNEEVRVPVAVETLHGRDLERVLEATTTLQSRQELIVVSETSGHLQRLDARVGEVVNEGQVLGRVENPESDAAVEEADALVARFERELGDLEPLLADGLIPRQAVDEVRFQLEQAEFQRSRARRQRGNREVRSPIRGVVTEELASVGQVLLPNQGVLRVADTESLVARVSLPERELLRIQQGMPAVLSIGALGGHEVEARLERILPTVDPRTGTLQVELSLVHGVEVMGGRHRLRPGMFVEAQIQSETIRDAVAVPQRAVSEEEGLSYVFVAKDTELGWIAERRELELGLRERGWTEVLSGVARGELLIVAGHQALSDGQAVMVVEQDGAPFESESVGAEEGRRRDDEESTDSDEARGGEEL